MDTRREEQQLMAYERYIAGLRSECTDNLGILAVSTVTLGAVLPRTRQEVQPAFYPESPRLSELSDNMASVAILTIAQRPQPNEINILGYAAEDYTLAA